MSRSKRSAGPLVVLWLAALVFLAHAVPARAASAEATVAADPLFDGLDEEFEGQPLGFPDPLESINRGTLRFNRTVDRWLLDPVTRAYRFVIPDPAKRAVRRVLSNLNAPVVLVNDVLQLEWTDAGVTVTRLALNTTIGVGGIFDPAGALGMEAHSSDFGQTLALAGVPSGPFLMLPILGPTTVRDGFGNLIDLLFRPTTYVLGPGDQVIFTTIHGGSSGLATREAHADELRLLEESTVDFYAALRNVYYQVRTAQIWERRQHRRPRTDADDRAYAAGSADHPAAAPSVSLRRP